MLKEIRKLAFRLGLTIVFLLVSVIVAYSQKPNIVFILADDLGYGDVSCLNEDGQIRTPNIDRLAETGVVFTDAHAAAATGKPTRYGILTGRYPFRNQKNRKLQTVYAPPLFDANEITMPSMLKKQGYKTACFGKWNLGFNWQTVDSLPPSNKMGHYNIDFNAEITGGPCDFGFDYFFGVDAPDLPPFTFIENRKVFSIPKMYYTEHVYAGCQPGMGVFDWKMDEILPEIKIRTVEYISKAASGSTPFFLFLPITSPHAPIAPSSPYIGFSGLNANADFVLETDDFVGAVLDALEKNGLTENTIVVFTSDNGCSPQAGFGELETLGHNPNYIFRGHKADLFEGGHHVPCMVRWPAKINEPRKVNQTICLNDFMTTFAAVSNYALSANEAEDSYNILPLLLGPETDEIIREATVHQSIDGSLAIRKGDWKLLLCAGSGGWSAPKPGKEEEGLPPIQLYNLKTDPGESINLQAKHPDKVKELRTLLDKYIKQGRSVTLEK
ncbi:MAG: arylsulfatase [Draconibacterium sp.]